MNCLRVLVAVAISVSKLASADATGEDSTDAAQDRPAPGDVRVLENIFADSVDFNAEGRCVARGNRSIRSWQLPGFPAAIPHFESCTTLQVKNLQGEAEFSMAIVDSGGKRLQRIEGVLVLSPEGKASQAAEWDHLNIPSPGIYYLVISVAGTEAKRIPLSFSKKITRSSENRKS